MSKYDYKNNIYIDHYKFTLTKDLLINDYLIDKQSI